MQKNTSIRLIPIFYNVYLSNNHLPICCQQNSSINTFYKFNIVCYDWVHLSITYVQSRAHYQGDRCDFNMKLIAYKWVKEVPEIELIISLDGILVLKYVAIKKRVPELKLKPLRSIGKVKLANASVFGINLQDITLVQHESSIRGSFSL